MKTRLNARRRLRHLSLITLCVALFGCGGSSSGETTPNEATLSPEQTARLGDDLPAVGQEDGVVPTVAPAVSSPAQTAAADGYDVLVPTNDGVDVPAPSFASVLPEDSAVLHARSKTIDGDQVIWALRSQDSSELFIDRITVSAEGETTLNASTRVGGTAADYGDEEGPIRAFEFGDFDGDGDVELHVQVTFNGYIECGSGGGTINRVVIVRTETLEPQLDVIVQRHADGTECGSFTQSETSMRDANGDGHSDFIVQRHTESNASESPGAGWTQEVCDVIGDEELKVWKRDREEVYHYNTSSDAYVLDGEADPEAIDDSGRTCEEEDE